MMSKRYLETFFDEKDLPEVSWELYDKNGVWHLIDSSVVKEAILQAPEAEQKAIANTIRRIDFANGNVNDFLKHLAQALVDSY